MKSSPVKKTFALFLSVCLLLTVSPLFAFAVGDITQDTIDAATTYVSGCTNLTFLESELFGAIKTATGADSVAWNSTNPYVLVPATRALPGSVSGSVDVTVGQDTTTVPLNLELPILNTEKGEIITDSSQKPHVSSKREPGDASFDVFDTGHPEFKLPAIGKNITGAASLYYDMGGQEIKNIDVGVVLLSGATLNDNYQIFYRLAGSASFTRLALEVVETTDTAVSSFFHNSVKNTAALPAGAVELKVSFTGAAGWYAFQEHLTLLAVDSLTLAGLPTVSPHTVPFGSTLSDVIGMLGATIMVPVKEGVEVSAKIAWIDTGTPSFDGHVANDYTFTGMITLPAGVKNPDGLSLEITTTVTVAPQSAEQAAPDIDIAQKLFDARNSTTQSDVLAAMEAAVKNQNLPVSVTGWTLTPADAKTPGSITGTLVVDGTSVPLSIFIPTLNYITDDCADLSYTSGQEGALENVVLAGRNAILKDPTGLTDGALPDMSLTYDMNGQYIRTVSIGILEKSGTGDFTLLVRRNGETGFSPVAPAYTQTQSNTAGSGYNAGIFQADFTDDVVELKLVLGNSTADALAITGVNIISCYFDPRVNFYENFIQTESAWIRSLQITSGIEKAIGAIPMTTVGRMLPYFSEIAVMALLDTQEPVNIEAAKGYIDWHFRNLNDGSSTHVLDIDGTVYDYNITATYGPDGGNATVQALPSANGDYDSSDSYAALLLSSLNQYYELTGDTQYLTDNFDNINRVLNALYATMSANKLTWAKINYKIEYMMDNGEVMEGLLNAIDIYTVLARELTGSDQALAQSNLEKVTQGYADVKAAIEQILWRSGSQDYFPYNGAGAVDWSTFYPDATCQVFAITTGVAGEYPGRAEALWAKFNSYYSGADTTFHWENIDIPDTYIWGSMAYAASLVGDYARVDTYVETYIKRFQLSDPQHDAPLYNADAGQTLRAACVMLDYYKSLAKGAEAEMAENPVATPASGTAFTHSLTVTLSSATADASIFYTTDGSLPTVQSGILYTGPITISSTSAINAIAVNPGVCAGTVVRFIYTKVPDGGQTIPDQPTPTSPWANPYDDVFSADWFYDDVCYVTEHKLMNGVSDNLFSPNTPMTRAMLVTVLWRMEKSPAQSGANGFTDVPAGMWYTDAIIWAAKNGIVQGYGNSLFGPGDMVARQDMATVLMRYITFAGTELTGGSPKIFTDAAQIAAYAKTAVEKLTAVSIINGKPNNLFDPTGSATRAEVAAILHRYAQYAETAS